MRLWFSRRVLKIPVYLGVHEFSSSAEKAKYRELSPFYAGLAGSKHLKIHIGDPHRQHLLIAEDVPLGAVGAFAVIGFVKVIHFYDLLFRGRTAVLT